MSFCVAGARDCAPWQKLAKREVFGVQKPWPAWGSTRDIFIRAVWRSGRWFPQRDCILEHQIFRFAEMILRDRCSTSYDLASLFRGRRSSLDSWKNPKGHWYEAVSSALNFPFLKDVSQNCFVFDVVNFKHWGSLAELLRFWCCQVQNLRASRRIASFSSLQIDR